MEILQISPHSAYFGLQERTKIAIFKMCAEWSVYACMVTYCVSVTYHYDRYICVSVTCMWTYHCGLSLGPEFYVKFTPFFKMTLRFRAMARAWYIGLVGNALDS